MDAMGSSATGNSLESDYCDWSSPSIEIIIVFVYLIADIPRNLTLLTSTAQGGIDVKNINLQIKNIKNMFLHFYKNIFKNMHKNIKTAKKRKNMFLK